MSLSINPNSELPRFFINEMTSGPFVTAELWSFVFQLCSGLHGLFRAV
jgi:hypothetical protein